MSFAETIERESPPKGSNAITMLWGTKQLKTGFSSYLALYEGFVGQVHFQVISKLLGYQGIAMILEQLLTNMDVQVRSEGDKHEGWGGGREGWWISMR